MKCLSQRDFCLLSKQTVNNQGLFHPYLFVLASSSAGEDHPHVKAILNKYKCSFFSLQALLIKADLFRACRDSPLNHETD